MKLILANPRGFCAGVDRAITIVEEAIKHYGAPVYVRHEIVHNRYVVEDLERKGAVFVKEVADIPEGAVTIFSAHGVSDAVEQAAKDRDLPVIDATCPLVTKVHKEAQRAEKAGDQVLLIGHAGHPEVEGTSGRVAQEVLLVSSVQEAEQVEVRDPELLSYVTQTTLSVDDTRAIIAVLQARFPAIKGPDVKDICYATQNRQDAVRELAKQVELLLVVGAKNSSNSNRLRDLGEECGVTSYLISDAEALQEAWFDGIGTIGLTAGASAPEILVEQVVEAIRARYPALAVSTMAGEPENVHFRLPPPLRAHTI